VENSSRRTGISPSPEESLGSWHGQHRRDHIHVFAEGAGSGVRFRVPSGVAAAEPAILRSLLAISRDDKWHELQPYVERGQLVAELQEVHALLAESGHEFGFRVMAESLRFAAIYSGTGRNDLNEILDLIAMQKLLPRLHGSRRRLETVLRALMSWSGLDEAAQAGEPGDQPPRLPRTAAKLQRMFASLQANQFVSFTE
jgi:5-methylcytosine-specific restriction protein B